MSEELSIDKIEEELRDPSISPSWFDEMLRRFKAIKEMQ